MNKQLLLLLLTQEVLAEGGGVPTLKDLWTKDKKERKHLSLLPNDYLFSAKGKIDYDNLEISEFVGGFLQFLNSQPESTQQRYLAYLKLLMERAATYSWNSVRNFHFSINTAVEARRLSLQQFDQIKDQAQTFFTHDYSCFNHVFSSALQQQRYLLQRVELHRQV